jgi:hypothetical protein
MNVPTAASSSLMRPPALVAALGYGGLIPFVGLAGLVMFGPADAMAFARGLLIAYGAVILSFVGALHWGFAMTLPGLDRTRKNRGYFWSVIPALMGFLAIAMDSGLSLSLLIVGFGRMRILPTGPACHPGTPGFGHGCRPLSACPSFAASWPQP